jgi:cupin 2 domain-containing protein
MRKKRQPPALHNLYDAIPAPLSQELVDTLLQAGNLRLERIVSHGHASAAGFWYDQDQDEWVLVLRGAARLRFEGQDRLCEMKPGDFLNIPAHARHRVEWTTPDEPTVWLALHHDDGRGP